MDKLDAPTAVSAYLSLGFKDYIASRHLLLDGFLLQGAILGSTAVEKYLKAVLWTLGAVPSGHLDQPRLKRDIASNFPQMHGEFNQEFITYLGHVYKLRYSDGISEVISVGVEPYKFLAELDYIVDTIESTLSRIDSIGQVLESKYHLAKNKNDNSVCRENSIIQGLNKTEYIERYQKLLLIHVDSAANALEIAHDSVRPINDGIFDKPKIKLSEDRLSAKIEFSGEVAKMFDYFK